MKTILPIIFFSFVINCAFKELKQPKELGGFNLISRSNTPPAVTEEPVSKPVMGENCKFVNLYSGSHPQISLAISDALAKSPGSKGLKNAKVSYYYATGYTLLAAFVPVILVFGYPLTESCYEVVGEPVK